MDFVKEKTMKAIVFHFMIEKVISVHMRTFDHIETEKPVTASKGNGNANSYWVPDNLP